MTFLVFTTNPGLEDIVGQEFGQCLQQIGLTGALKLDVRPAGFKGYVLIGYNATLDTLWSIAQQLHSVHDILQPISSFDLPKNDSLDEIRQYLAQEQVPALECATSFRVTSKCYGILPFTNMEVQIAAGAGLVERYGTKVDLENYAVNIRVDVYGPSCLVGVQLNSHVLSKRHARLYTQRTALKSTVAYAMLKLAAVPDEPVALLDPFCGTGTILMEAASLFSQLMIYGSDSNAKAVEGTRRNIEHTGASAVVQLYRCQAQLLDKVYAGVRFQAIVTNPPYGVRLLRGRDLYALYYDFLKSAHAVLEDQGRIVVLVWQNAVFERVVQNLKLFLIVYKLGVETGGIYPRIYVLEPVLAASLNIADNTLQEFIGATGYASSYPLTRK